MGKKLIEVEKIETKEIVLNASIEIIKEIPANKSKVIEIDEFSRLLNDAMNEFTENRSRNSVKIKVF